MRKILLPLLCILCSTVKLYAIVIPTPFVNQTKYRWRNDDGNETAATWRAAENTAISLNDTTTRLRARLELQNNSGATHTVNESLEYSSNAGATWTTMTNAATDAFIYVSSAHVANGGATTNQMGSATLGTFLAGKIVSALPAPASFTIDTDNKTEFEWVIKPTGNLLPMATYIFRSAEQGATPVNYATINTGCVNVTVVSKKDSARCGPGMVGLKASGSPGTTIKWYQNASGGVAIATGTDFVTPLLAGTKTYYAAAALGATCESPRIAVTATIHPLPVVNLGPDQTVCEGDPATFNAGNFSAYLWDNGSASQTRTVNTPGAYYVTVTGAGNCKGSDTVKLLNHPKPIVDLGGDTSICPGSSIVLNAGNPGMSYTWDDGSTGQTRAVNLGGTYSVTVTNQFNCHNSDMINVIIKDLPLGNINAVYGSAATYTFEALNPMYTTDYIWNFGDGSAEVHGVLQQHTYNANGIYTVKLVLVGDCDSNATKYRTVDVFDAGATGIMTPGDNKAISVYPNPAKDKVMLESRLGAVFKSVEVFNILGQKVAPAWSADGSKITLYTAPLPSGIYTLRVLTDRGLIIRKVDIRK